MSSNDKNNKHRSRLENENNKCNIKSVMSQNLKGTRASTANTNAQRCNMRLDSYQT